MTLFVGNLIVLFNTFRVLHRRDGKIPHTFYGSGVSRIECIFILSILQDGQYPFQLFYFFIFPLLIQPPSPLYPNWTSCHEFLLTSGGTLFSLLSRSTYLKTSIVLAGPRTE